MENLGGFLAEVLLAIVETITDPPRLGFLHVPQVVDKGLEICDLNGLARSRFEAYRTEIPLPELNCPTLGHGPPSLPLVLLVGVVL